MAPYAPDDGRSKTHTGQNNIPQFRGGLKASGQGLLRHPALAEENVPVGRPWIAILAVSLLSGSAATGQTLAEVAKKERERRDRAGKDGRETLVISEKELKEARGDSLSVSGSRSEDPPPTGPSEEEAVPSEAASKLTANEIRDLREQWARIWKEQLSQAEQELERAKDDVYQCRSAERFFYVVPLAVDCDGVDLRLAAAESRLRVVKRNRYHWELLLPEDQNR